MVILWYISSMELVKNNVYFSKRFGLVIYIDSIIDKKTPSVVRIPKLETWKFLNINNTETPIFNYINTSTNDNFYCSVEFMQLEKLPENINKNTLQILYGANSE